MSELALAIYGVLRAFVNDPTDRMTYQRLTELLRPRWRLHWQSPELSEALGDLVRACHQRVPPLPAIPAMVIRDDTGRPGDGYYPTAHPAEFELGQAFAIEAWGRELDLARETEYPVEL